MNYTTRFLGTVVLADSGLSTQGHGSGELGAPLFDRFSAEKYSLPTAPDGNAHIRDRINTVQHRTLFCPEAVKPSIQRPVGA